MTSLSEEKINGSGIIRIFLSRILELIDFSSFTPEFDSTIKMGILSSNLYLLKQINFM